MAVLATLSRWPLRLQRQALPGERGVVLLLAPDMKQAKVLLDYAEGTLESTPMMRQLLDSANGRHIDAHHRHYP